MNRPTNTQPSAGGLRLQMFGGLHVTRNGEPLDGFVSAKVQALLCFLAVTGVPHQRTTLATMFWPDNSDADAATNLRQALANLRRVVEPHLLITRQIVAFNRDSAYWLDVQAFEACFNDRSAQDRVERMRTASQLYVGDFLQDFSVRGAPAFDDWALNQQTRYRNLAVSAFRILIDEHIARDEFEVAIALANTILRLDALHEETHRRLMWLLHRTGQSLAALQHYEICRQLLWNELGSHPSRETSALAEQIRQHQSNPRQMLPVTPTTFIGREEEQAEIARRLADPNCRLVTIVGPGGIGKTRLALHIAARHADQFMDGVVVAQLATVQSSDQLGASLFKAFGRMTLRQRDVWEQALAYLEPKALLLTLDNFEHLVETGADLVSEILECAPHVKVLVTSRERLNLQEEWLIPLEGLRFPPKDVQNDLETYSAARLFIERARRVRPHWSLRNGEQEDVATICRLVEGMPLGIELAAATMRALSPADIAQELAHNWNFLHSTLRNIPERQRSLRATFEYSWRLLAPQEQIMFSKLAVFRGGFRREAAAFVAGASLPLLHSLVDKSLLRSSDGRFDMHELLRQYAEEKLREDSNDYQLTLARHFEYYVAFLERQETPMLRDKSRSTTDAINEELENLWFGVSWAIDHGQTPVLRTFLRNLRLFYEVRGRLQEGAVDFERAVAHIEIGSTALNQSLEVKEGLLSYALANYGLFLARLGAYEQATPVLRRGLAFAQRHHLKPEYVFCRNQLGNVAVLQGRILEAKEHYQEYLAIQRTMHNPEAIAVPLNNLGYVAILLGDYEEARMLLAQSLALCSENRDRWGIAFCLNNLAEVDLAEQKLDDAAQRLAETYEIYAALDDRRGLGEATHSLADVAVARQDYFAASGLYRDSLAFSTEVGDRRKAADTMAKLGNLARLLGQTVEAYSYISQSLQAALELQADTCVLYCLLVLARLLTNEGEKEKAVELIACIVDHYATEKRTRDQAAQMLAQLRPRVDPQLFRIAHAQGKTRQLAELAEAYIGVPHSV